MQPSAGSFYYTSGFDLSKPIVYTHIPKCAGNTVIALLRQISDQTRTRMLAIAGASSRFGSDGDLDALLADKGIRLGDFFVITGHLPFVNFIDKKKSFNFMVSLRDPVKRSLSDAYSQPQFVGNHNAAFKKIIEVVQSTSPTPEYLIDNLHVRMLASDPRFGQPCSTEMMWEAVLNVDRYYGTVFTDECIEQVCADIGGLFGLRTAPVPRLNATERPPEIIPDDVICALEEYNRYDIELVFALRALSRTRSRSEPVYRVSTTAADNPTVPEDWRVSAPDVILNGNGHAEVSTPWVQFATRKS